jgi:tetratricopeptide (TPR) repeat protein
MTETTISLPFVTSTRLFERQQWISYYESRLHDQLKWAASYIQSHEDQPSEVIRHLNSFATLLHQARRYPSMYPLALTLISALHPWPARWGYWDMWKTEVLFAIRAATQLGRLDLQAKFQAYLADILFQTGKFHEAVENAKQAVYIARNDGALDPLLSAAETSINALRALGLAQQADDGLEEFQNIAVEIVANEKTVPWKRAEVMARIAWLQMGSAYGKEHTADALMTIAQAIAFLETSPFVEPAILASIYNLRGVVLWRQDEYAQAVQHIKKALDLFSQQGDVFSQASLSGNLGIVYWSMGEFTEAENVLHHCINITEKLNAHARLLKAIRVLAAVYLARGQLQKALRYCERHLELALELNEPFEISGATANRGSIRLHLHKYDAARRDLEAELAVDGDKTHVGVGCSYANLSRCYAGLGQREYGLELAKKAWNLAEINGSARLQIVALRCMAEYQSPAKNKELLHEALILTQKHARPFDQAACLLVLAHLSNNEAERFTLWQQGVNLLKQMGATAWLRGHSITNPPCLPLIV